MQPRAHPVIRAASSADAKLLAEIGERTFRDTFAADNTPENLSLYLAKTYGEDKQFKELVEPTAIFLLAFVGDQPGGYAKLRIGPAPSDVRGPNPMEIERFYVERCWWGVGIGDALMRACEAEARRRGHRTLWLGVWEHNARAKAFYARWGFQDVGSQLFVLGTDRQTDRILMRPL